MTDLYDSIPLARTTDPSTSHEAAEAIKDALANLQAWAIDCVRQSPGKTQRELGVRYCPEDLRKIGRRLNECEKRGLIRRGESRQCTISKRRADTWWPIDNQETK